MAGVEANPIDAGSERYATSTSLKYLVGEIFISPPSGCAKHLVANVLKMDLAINPI
jgi:hypothetical protein